MDTITIKCAHCGATNNVPGQPATSLLSAAQAVLASYENYASEHKPREEWDEYDHMMFPDWARLRTEVAKGKER